MNWGTLLVGLAGAVIGGALSLLGAYLKERVEIAKIKLAYEQHRNDAYLENARSHVDDLYVPLYRLVSILYNCFLEVRGVHALRGDRLGDVGNAAMEKLREAYTQFDTVYESWVERGLTSYFIYDLEEKCVLLRNFIRNSVAQSAVRIEREILITMSTPVCRLRWPLPFFSQRRFMEQVDISEAKALPKIKLPRIFGFSVMPGWLRYEVAFRKQVLSAPVTSQEFERQFTEYVTVIKETVREVTLGK